MNYNEEYPGIVRKDAEAKPHYAITVVEGMTSSGRPRMKRREMTNHDGCRW